jgi:molybdopterin/thiamine biosynthesis adenylyltransferase
MIDDRYDRQLRLAEIGGTGQARIAAHRARIAAGPSAGVALAYLVRAGVGAGLLSRDHSLEFPHGRSFGFSGPLAFAAGAHQALVELKRALASAEASP